MLETLLYQYRDCTAIPASLCLSGGISNIQKKVPCSPLNCIYSAHSSEAIIQLWQNRSAQVPPHNLAQAARSPQHHLPLSDVSSTVGRNPEQLLLYEHFQRVLRLFFLNVKALTCILAKGKCSKQLISTFLKLHLHVALEDMLLANMCALFKCN